MNHFPVALKHIVVVVLRLDRYEVVVLAHERAVLYLHAKHFLLRQQTLSDIELSHDAFADLVKPTEVAQGQRVHILVHDQVLVDSKDKINVQLISLMLLPTLVSLRPLHFLSK